MTSRTQLSVDLIAKVGGFEAGMKRASAAADGLGNKLRGAAGVAGAAAAGAFAAYGAASAAFVKQAINRADELGEAAEKMGIPVEVLSSFEYASRFGGIAFEKLEAGLGRLVKAQSEAAQGSERINEVFDALGIAATNVDGSLRPTEQVLLDLADRFQALPDGPQKAALAMEIFGKAGRDLIPFLNKGREGIKELTDEAQELGVVVGGETARLAGEFNDQMDRLQASAQGAALSVAEKLLPGLLATNGPLDQFVQLLKDPGVQEGFSNIISGALTAVGALAKFAAETANVTKFIAEEIASRVNGASGDDIARLEDQAKRLRDGISTLEADPLGNLLGFNEESLKTQRAKLEKTEAQIKAFYASVDEQGKAAAAPAKGAAAPVAVNSSGEVNVSGLFSPSANDTGATGGRSAAAAAAREQAAAQKELDEALKQTAEASADFNAQLVAYRDEVAGPLAQVQTEWAAREQQLQELAARGEISQEQLAEALAYTTELRQRDVEAINAQLSPAAQVLADLEEELRLLSLTNEERELANALKYAGVDATSAEGEAIAEALDRVKDAREQIQAADDLRRGFEDTFASIIDGSKSAKEAFEDLGSYITQLIAQRLASQLTESLFGGAGGPLGGSAGGGGFGAFLGAIFGGGRAAGGWVSPGKLYEVAENGPEMLRVGNRQFLLPTATGGMVTPNARMGGGGGVSQVINVQGRVDTRTANQLAQEAGRAQRRASARFGA